MVVICKIVIGIYKTVDKCISLDITKGTIIFKEDKTDKTSHVDIAYRSN